MSSLMDELLQEARGLQGKSIAESSRRVYESRLRVYRYCCENELKVPAEPITSHSAASINIENLYKKLWMKSFDF